MGFILHYSTFEYTAIKLHQGKSFSLFSEKKIKMNWKMAYLYSLHVGK